ncbi:hypothetical protein BJY01DRAFT_250231 [Aspergillus pseudoustus]|uniref:Uncharacterized protein n=1 Tax=Aspergillus pseudoustus TaxID=1810923 RepID=A0ABR4JIU3_9EURO
MGTFPFSTSDDGFDICTIDREHERKAAYPRFAGNILVGDVHRSIRDRAEIVKGRAENHGSIVSGTGLSLLKRKVEALEKDLTCPTFGYDTFNCIFSLGRAHGSQRSPERITQLQKLWADNIQELHSAIPHSEEMYGRWVEEFSNLTEGQSFFLKVLSTIPQSEYFEALSRVCNSTGRHKKRFDGPTKTTEIKSGLWFPRQEIRAYRAELSPRIKTKDLQGFPIEIRHGGESKIKWLTASDAKRTLAIEIPRCAVPETGFDSRALSFTEHRIDIVDASGGALRAYVPWEKEPSSATLPRWTFKTKNGQLLQELWEAVRSELGHVIPTNRITAIPPRRDGVGLVPSNRKTDTTAHRLSFEKGWKCGQIHL